MLQLVYISTARPKASAAVVEDILRVSRRNNARDGISGLLYHDGKRFMQALEGDAATVETAYDRIAADPRHIAVVRLSSRVIEKREFGDWAMASRPFAGVMADEVTSQVDALVARASPSIRAHFESFARLRAA